MAGRFAPTPTSPLHVGNLRTALGAWLAARSSGRAFRLRVDDLDHDGPIVYQSARTKAYEAALETVRPDVYECFCSRREIALAAQAPHASDGLRPYPGTCRHLTPGERAALRRHRAPALRIRADGATVSFRDLVAGPVAGVVDDFVVRRGDGVFAYNFAVVVDDAFQGVDQVVRGDDLASSAVRQAWLARRLGVAVPQYAHLPLAVGPTGRLAKRDGALSLARLLGEGWTIRRLVALLARSLGLAVGDEATPAGLVEGFDWARLPRQPWLVDLDSTPPG